MCALSSFIRTIGHIKASILVAKIPMCHSENRTLDLLILFPMLYSFATKHSNTQNPKIRSLFEASRPKTTTYLGKIYDVFQNACFLLHLMFMNLEIITSGIFWWIIMTKRQIIFRLKLSGLFTSGEVYRHSLKFKLT